MKLKYLIFLSLFLVLSSCDESSKTIISVQNDYTAIGSGTMIAEVNNEGAPINLSGKVSIEEGLFIIYLTNPLSDTIYTRTFKGIGDFKEDKDFERMLGTWTFSYEIIGEGKTQPSGSFDFDLTYRN